MATNLENRETLELRPEDAEDRAFVEHLRANGVRVATGSLDRPRVIGKQRPPWLAFIIRTLRSLHLTRE